MFELLSREGGARRGRMRTVHGDIETPVFMNVGTLAAIKGALDCADLENIGCQVQLSNTYHLHLRPGDGVIRSLGGLHGFMGWNRPILTDSGGFQVFSLAKLRKIEESGVRFASHIDGRAVFMGPEDSINIQSNLGSTIAMAFDECIENPAPRDYVRASTERTLRWLVRCRDRLVELNAGDVVNREQLLFGINQGGVYEDIRVWHMQAIAELELPGYAIGGLAVGESAGEMYSIIDAVAPHMPELRPRYLMGVGTPVNILEAVARGIDFFDCVLPARNARHGHVFTWSGVRNLKNERYKLDDAPIDEGCGCPTCARYSRAYLRHLFVAGEMLAMRLAVLHNLWFYNNLMARVRGEIERGRYASFMREHISALGKRV